MLFQNGFKETMKALVKSFEFYFCFPFVSMMYGPLLKLLTPFNLANSFQNTREQQKKEEN